MPPVPKPASVRRGHRSNASRSVLYPVVNPEIPELPAYCNWHPAVVEFWEDAWASPMPQEWTESDKHNVLMAARAMQTAWDPESSPTARSTASAEVRLFLRECGLTPMSRRTLQIEIARAENAQERTTQIRAARKPSVVPDPREAFREAQ